MDLFASGFAVFDDFLGENLGIGKVVGLFEALLASRSIGSRLIANETSLMSPESTFRCVWE